MNTDSNNLSKPKPAAEKDNDDADLSALLLLLLRGWKTVVFLLYWAYS
ncbi:hypothetical protein [Psychrobacter frigidicola]|nr:hypothetical protein [Psychrobacter frigidicola]